jgi:hypothetical protein
VHQGGPASRPSFHRLCLRRGKSPALNVYGRSKLAGEEKVRERLAARHPAHELGIFLPWREFRQDGPAACPFAAAAANSRRSDRRSNRCRRRGEGDSRDRACMRAAALCRGTYHFSGAPAVSWYEFARAIVAKRGTPVVPIPTKDFPRPARRPLMCSIAVASSRHSASSSRIGAWLWPAFVMRSQRAISETSRARSRSMRMAGGQ